MKDVRSPGITGWEARTETALLKKFLILTFLLVLESWHKKTTVSCKSYFSHCEWWVKNFLRLRFRNHIFDDARDDIEDVLQPELPVERTPPNSPAHQPEQPVQPENPAPIHDQALDNQQDARPNRHAPRRNRSRSRSQSPRHNPHENSKYTVICYWQNAKGPKK